MPSKLILSEEGIDRLYRLFIQAGGFWYTRAFKMSLGSVKAPNIPFVGKLIAVLMGAWNFLFGPKINVVLEAEPIMPLGRVAEIGRGSYPDAVKLKVAMNLKVGFGSASSKPMLALEFEPVVRPRVFLKAVMLRFVDFKNIKVRVLKQNVPAKYVQHIPKLIKASLPFVNWKINDLLSSDAVQSFNAQGKKFETELVAIKVEPGKLAFEGVVR